MGVDQISVPHQRHVPMLQMHQRYVQNIFGPSSDDIDFRQSFPRLVLLAVRQPSEDLRRDDEATPAGVAIYNAPVHLTLFRPVSFDQLSALLLPVSAGPSNVVAIYGTILGEPDYHEHHHLQIVNVTSLEIKKGAGLLPPNDRSDFDVERDGQTIYRVEDWMQLEIEQTSADQETAATINIVLDFLKVSSKSPLRENYEPELYLSCAAAIADSFNRILSEKQPFRLDLEVNTEP